MKRPEKVKCYPINHSTILVEYQSKMKWNDIVYYTSSKTDTGTQIWLSNHLESVNKKEFQIKRLKLPLFETFWFFIRGLERTGSEKKGESGSPHTLFEMSRLSKGIKCSLQGRTYKIHCILYILLICNAIQFHFYIDFVPVEIYSVVHAGGIFIWWPQIMNINVTHFLVQFWHNDSSSATKFSDQIIGTTDSLGSYAEWSDIHTKLVKIFATTNIYPQPDSIRPKRSFPSNLKNYKSHLETRKSQIIDAPDEVKDASSNEFDLKNIAISEIRIPSNVTGILLPNTNKIVVRVLVPVMDGDTELDQDMSYVDWKIVNNFILLTKLLFLIIIKF